MSDDTTDDDSPPPGKRSSAVVVAERVEQILSLRIAGASFAGLRDFAAQSGWGVSDSQLKKYVQKSDLLLKERTESGRGRATRLHLARREMLFARALQVNDHRTALAVLDSSAKLRGLLDDPKKLQAEAAEMLARIATLEDAARAGRTTTPTERPGAAPAGEATAADPGGVEPHVPPA